MKKITIILYCILCTSVITGCNNKNKCERKGHDFTEATCTTPQTCKVCNETKGDTLEHSFLNATCTTPQTCALCGVTKGDALGHSYLEATFTTPKTCKVCGETSGNPYTELNATLTYDYISLGEYAYIKVPNYYDMTSFSIEYDGTQVSIDDYGKVIGLKEGIANIKISKISNSNTVSFLTLEILGTKPKFYTETNKVGVGATTHINIVNFNELEESSLSDFNITFENNLLKVNDDFSLSGVAIGTEIITVSSKKDPRISSSKEIKVVDGTTNFLLSTTSTTGIVKAGEQVKLNINIQNKDNLVWGSSDSKIAVVNDKGIVNTKREGIVIITVYDKTDVYNADKKCSYTIIVSGTTEVDYVSRLIRTALGEYGVKETGDNVQKYGEWYGYNGAAWCAMFVSWSWYHAGLENDLLLKYMGCSTGLTWCAENDIIHFVRDFDFGKPLKNGKQRYAQEDYTPESGDIVFFLNGISHTGIVIYADSDYIYTIEGNTSNMVAVRKWSLKDSRITAYAKPNYPDCSNPEDFSWIKNPLSNGTYWWDNAGDNGEVL